MGFQQALANNAHFLALPAFFLILKLGFQFLPIYVNIVLIVICYIAFSSYRKIAAKSKERSFHKQTEATEKFLEELEKENQQVKTKEAKKMAQKDKRRDERRKAQEKQWNQKKAEAEAEAQKAAEEAS
eukprot:CAMPEP_0117764318 /NCGR_PEP_ID=MMETSP0947-20121206/19308_1 /TAXON_ID=44440 /ORGANISM="Chattonella subsalsa, Strain CCMP2191" /LENGTH=127 /DNA_ID=CAMNT_0005586485 /DNA_START=55 /DNA_END=435 /DNA_ORIENTATION=-